MRRNIALTLYLGCIVFGGCDKKADYTAQPPAPSPTSTSNPPAPQAPPAPTGNSTPGKTGAISGVVKLDGWLKSDGPIGNMRQVPACAVVHKDGIPNFDTLVMGDGQTMANVLVYVKGGVPGRKHDTPKEGVIFDQVGCIYTPHGHAVMTNQPVTFRNGDTGILHNVNGSPKLNESFNKGQLNKGDQNTFQFPNEEIAINVQCNVHPWMSAYLHVLSHPYFKLTAKDGAYKIEGLPAGTYEVRAWHERFKD